MNKLETFLIALINHAKDSYTKVSSKQKMERIVLCFKCEHKTLDWKCGLCGCSIELKSEWRSEFCPLKNEEYPNGKWAKISLDTIETSKVGGCGCSNTS